VLNLLLRSFRAKDKRPSISRPAAAPLPSLEGFEQLLEDGNIDAAERLARVRLDADPGDIDGLAALAGVMAERGLLAEACLLAERVAAAGPDRADHLCAAAEINRRAGRDSQALLFSEMSCRADPALPLAWILRAFSLEVLGRNAEAYDTYHRAITLDPCNRDIHSSLLFMLYTSGIVEPETVVEEHRAWASAHADPLTPAHPRHANSAQPERPLRLGYVSSDFRRHVVGYFIEPVLAHHDRRAFQVYCYSGSPTADDRTAVFRALADIWRDVSGENDEGAAAMIRADAIDILIDLSGHTRGNRLGIFARKPAPVQASWLGYLGTTGLKAMDYCITDGYTDPPGASECHYVERLIRLPTTQWCYSPPSDAPPVSPLPALRRGYVTFGSFAHYSRLNVHTFQAWARILRALPEARLSVTGVTGGDPTDRLFETLEAGGISADRVDIRGRIPYRDYLTRLSEVDIALGAFPYTGAATTCEAVWMGVPLVCLAGGSRPGRSSASILSALQLPEWVAQDWDGYCAVAVRLASDIAQLEQLRAGLRERMRRSPVTDAARFTAALEAEYRNAWRRWCAGTSGGPVSASG